MRDDIAFADIAAEFHQRIKQMVWCNLATIDTSNRPRSRIVQPIWEAEIGWIATHRQSLKAIHVAHNSAVSLAYIGDNIRPLYIEGTVVWVDDLATKQHVWELARTSPPPLDYDLTPLYQSAANPRFGVLCLRPRRIELADMFGQPRVWRSQPSAHALP